MQIVSSKKKSVPVTIPHFRCSVLDCKLEDIGSSGCEYTWTNKQDDNTRVWSKLDRALANPAWFSTFPATYTTFLPTGVSDHSLVLVNIYDDYPLKSRFSFLNYWISHPSYKALIAQAWNNSVEGTSMYRLVGKLKHVRNSLSVLYKHRFNDLATRVTKTKAKTALLDCQKGMQDNPLSQDLINRERLLLEDYNTLKAAEMSVVKQKAKIENIRHDDCSTKYFFSRIQERKQQQIIGSIVDRHGTDRIGLTEVAEGFVDYYAHIIGSDKSPGPDGFSSAFFKDSLDLIGEDFCRAIHEFFRTGDVPLVNRVVEILDDFASWSGLKANISKTEIYFGEVPNNVKAEILNDTGFVEGRFPFRYLGIPLNSAKNSLEVYGALLTKIQNCLLHWSNGFLSYAGRIQIFKSVFFGIANFWCGSALLPKNIMKRINKICKDYFWNNIEEGQKKMVFLSWQVICRPYKEGGFNVKELL
ncbi:uncharacterized protein LOC141630078 [Silene latifolia]|uniref:uncharacterized protein LOC141630078 n=1 Tax=Silene latifolia TaxID=37657 RepID=UPI003D786724